MPNKGKLLKLQGKKLMYLDLVFVNLRWNKNEKKIF